MNFVEYPKSLYMGGDAAAAHVIVQDAAEEEAKRAEGFCMHGEEAEEKKPAEPTLEDVRAQLDAADIQYDKRWGLERVKALLPKN